MKIYGDQILYRPFTNGEIGMPDVQRSRLKLASSENKTKHNFALDGKLGVVLGVGSLVHHSFNLEVGDIVYLQSGTANADGYILDEELYNFLHPVIIADDEDNEAMVDATEGIFRSVQSVIYAMSPEEFEERKPKFKRMAEIRARIKGYKREYTSLPRPVILSREGV